MVLVLADLQEIKLYCLPWWCLWEGAELVTWRHSPLSILYMLLPGKRVATWQLCPVHFGPHTSSPGARMGPSSLFPTELSPSSCRLLAQPWGSAFHCANHCVMNDYEIFPKSRSIIKRPQSETSAESMNNPVTFPLLLLPSGCPLMWYFLSYSVPEPNHTQQELTLTQKAFCTTDPGFLDIIQGEPVTSQEKSKFKGIRY